MTKGSDFDFVGLYAALLKDIAAYFPTDQSEWARDLSRITTLSQNRGSSVFLMDLPALGKRFDVALSHGRLDVAGMPLAGRINTRTMIPRLFRGLWMRVFDDSGCLKQDIDPNVVLFLRTLLYTGKNFKSDCAPRYLFEATKEFYDVDTSLPPPSEKFDGDGSDSAVWDNVHVVDMVSNQSTEPLFPERDESFVRVLDSVQRMFDRISTTLSGFDPESLHFRHGPGAVSDLRKGDYKYSFPNWAPRLEYYFPFDLSATTSLETGEIDPSLGYGWDSVEPHSVLIAVPKTMKGPRLIAKEPTCHQWIQQGIRDFVYEKVHRSWMGMAISFNDQNPSRNLALLGSKVGELATIDLKSASDRISCCLVERVFRRNPAFLGALIASRTRFLVNELDKKEARLLKLRKFSTQGSALTFPIQSLVFLGVCLGVGRHLQPHRSLRAMCRQVRVFGDDLIVPKSWEPLVRDVLHALHLRVNLTKTHTGGNFRESCGMDAFRGYDVTPAYVLANPVESDPASISSGLAVGNNFFMKGFWHAATWLDRSMPSGILSRIPVAKIGSGLFARLSYSGWKLPLVTKIRYNHDLHRDEVKILTVLAKNRPRRTDTAANLLQYFTEEPPPYIRYESGVVTAGAPVLRSTWVEAAYFSPA